MIGDKNMSNGSKAFVKITQQQVWDKVNDIDSRITELCERLDDMKNHSAWTRRVAYSALFISAFVAEELIRKGIGG